MNRDIKLCLTLHKDICENIISKQIPVTVVLTNKLLSEGKSETSTIKIIST